MDEKKDSEQLFFLKSALKFIPKIWDEEGKKCTQLQIAKRIGVTNSYLSKAKDNASYAQNLRRKIMDLISSLGGTYSDEKKVFYDKNGNPFQLQTNTGAQQPLRFQYGIDTELFKIHIARTKSVRILTTWSWETYANLIDVAEEIPGIWESLEKIEILMLAPNSMGTFMRSKALGFNSERGFNRIKEDLQEIANTPKLIRDKLEVRLYDELPSIKLIMLDDLIIMGFFMFKELTGVGYHFMINPKHDPQVTASLKKHYQKLWDNAQSFDFAKAEQQLENWNLPAYRRHNVASYTNFEGVYYLYYPEKYPADVSYKSHKTMATIGCNILEIKKQNNGSFSVRMKPVGFDEEAIFEGELINLHFNNPDYLLLQLSNKKLSRHVHFSFSVKNAKRRKQNFGLFSAIYGSSGKLGSGYAVLVPIDLPFEKLRTQSLDPVLLSSDPKNPHTLLLGEKAVQYLIQKQKSLLNPVMKQEELAYRLANQKAASTPFFKSACYDALMGDIDACLANLAQAVSLGWTGFGEFKAFLAAHNVGNAALGKEINRMERSLSKK